MEILSARWIEMNEVLCVSDAELDLEILCLRLRAKAPSKIVLTLSRGDSGQKYLLVGKKVPLR